MESICEGRSKDKITNKQYGAELHDYYRILDENHEKYSISLKESSRALHKYGVMTGPMEQACDCHNPHTCNCGNRNCGNNIN